MTPSARRSTRGAALVGLGLLLLSPVIVRSVSARPGTPLALAAHNGDVTAIRALAAAGADVNEADSHGYTPLAWAARGGQPLRPHVCRPQDPAHLEAVRVLLDLGADPNQPSVNGWLADRMARHHKQDAAAELIARARGQ